MTDEQKIAELERMVRKQSAMLTKIQSRIEFLERENNRRKSEHQTIQNSIRKFG